ncbi:MAG: hypothetical protein ACLVCH_13135 [Roseburia inulinivorans]
MDNLYRWRVSYVFILPLVCILILYKDPKFIRTMMGITLFVLISSNLYKGLAKGMMDFVASEECVLQFAIVASAVDRMYLQYETIAHPGFNRIGCIDGFYQILIWRASYRP